MKALTSSKLLALVALVIFVLEAVGSFPTSLREDVSPVALGLAFLAGSLIVD
jgi:hypothetical protein